jgi:hypothetical protein
MPETKLVRLQRFDAEVLDAVIEAAANLRNYLTTSGGQCLSGDERARILQAARDIGYATDRAREDARRLPPIKF